MGPGAGPMMTEYHLGMILGQDPQRRMAKALLVGQEVDWIVAAERVIASKLAGCKWHIEDDQGQTIDDDWKGNQLAQAARRLVEDPQGELPTTGPESAGRRLSRRQFLTVTSGAMGLAGNEGWYLDMLDGLGLPHAILPISPERLTPDLDAHGVLQVWALDRRAGHPGMPIELDRLRLLQLIPPFRGVFGRGLVESALAKAINNGLVDQHYTALLRSGGRISGILSPKDAPITDDTQFEQLIRDWRNIVEQPEAARRLQVVRAPVEFTSTVMGVGEMQIIDLMYQIRDSLLGLWGVPLSQLGGTAATGLNSGDSRKYDEAALWQAAVHDRLTEVREAFQSVLDLWEPHLGWAPRLCFDEPEFDDESPAYDRAKSAEGQPLRNWERRAILGLDPIGDPELDNQIWMPMQVVAMAQAPDEDGRWPVATGRSTLRQVDNAPAVAQEPGQMATDVPATKPAPAPFGKASLDGSARRFRATVEGRITPRLQGALRSALAVQRDDVAAAVERNWASISQHGGRDESQWWRDGHLGEVIEPTVTVIARQTADHVAGTFGGS